MHIADGLKSWNVENPDISELNVLDVSSSHKMSICLALVSTYWCRTATYSLQWERIVDETFEEFGYDNSVEDVTDDDEVSTQREVSDLELHNAKHKMTVIYNPTRKGKRVG